MKKRQKGNGESEEATELDLSRLRFNRTLAREDRRVRRHRSAFTARLRIFCAHSILTAREAYRLTRGFKHMPLLEEKMGCLAKAYDAETINPRVELNF